MFINPFLSSKLIITGNNDHRLIIDITRYFGFVSTSHTDILCMFVTSHVLFYHSFLITESIKRLSFVSINRLSIVFLLVVGVCLFSAVVIKFSFLIIQVLFSEDVSGKRLDAFG